MTSHPRLVAVFACLACGAAAAPDMLPLKRGIYVPVGRACRGASNADMVNYWGGRNSIGAAEGTCTIKHVAKRGNVYTLTDICKDVASGAVIEGGPTVVEIGSPMTFRMSGTSYRYCGPKAVF